MRFNKKRIIAILVFLLLSFFMITFGNPLENKAVVTRNVKFIDSYDEKLLAEKTVELGKAVTAPTVPKHKDLVFINWYIKGTDTVANLDRILTNSTFVTRYADDKNNNGIDDKIDKYYTVKFIDGLNNNVLKTQKVLISLDASAPVIPTHEGYTFGAWDTNFTNVKKNLTVTGSYNINSYDLTINYKYAKDSSKAADPYSNSHNYNTNYSVTSPVIAGYTANKLVVSGTIPAANVSLDILYNANKDTIYKVEHYKEALDGSYVLSQTDNMVGTTDTLTAAIAETYTGFTVKTFDQVNINGNGSTVVKIYYTRNIYTLTYKVDGALYDSFNIKYEETITPLVNPTKVGYTFNGWSTIPAKMPASNVEINGAFKVNKYCLTIIYINENGLPIRLPYMNSVNYGSSYSVTSPTIIGYTVDKPVVSGIMPASDKTIFVTYKANRNTPYKINYYKNGVLFETENKTGTTDSIVSILPDLNKYTGYYYDILKPNWLLDTIHGDGSTVLKVYYKTYYYSLNYNSNKPSGIVGASLTPWGRSYTVEDEFNITATMSSTSHNFLGWYANSAGTGSAITKIEQGSTGNKTLYAKWDIKKYTVTFDEGEHGSLSGTSTPNISYNSTFGSIAKPLVTPDAGYTFTDWSITDSTKITGDVTATAQYTANTNTAYKVEHYTENLTSGYTLIGTDNLTGTTDTLTEAVARTLTGFTAKAFDQANIAGNGSTVVEIQYSRNVNTLTYKVDGTLYDSFNIKYDEAITPLTKPTKIGYTFSDWSTIPAKMPDNDVLVTGTFTINSHNLTINYKYSDGDEAYTEYSDSYNYNTGYSITSPVIAGYTADKLVVSGTMPDNNVTVDVTYTANKDTAYKVEHYTENLTSGYTLIGTDNLTGTTDTLTSAAAKTLTGFTAKAFDQVNIAGNGLIVVKIYYARNIHTLTYKVDGSTYDSFDMKYEEVITPLTKPTKTGYTFSDWSAIPSTMPDNAVNVTGTFTINSHNLTINYKYSNGDEAHTGYSHTYDYNTGYSITSPVIAGYTADKLVVSGTMPDNNVTVDVTYTANKDTVYKVEHYLQNIGDNDYAHEASYDEDKTGTTDTLTAATARTLTGFTAKAFDQANINGNGETVIKIYYDRLSYNLTFNPDNGSDLMTSTVKYGATISAPSVTKTGYTFVDWTPNVPATMPDSDSTYKATWTINSHNLTITYKYSDGDEAHAEYSNTYNYNVGYSVTSPVIAGYTADKLVVSGTMPDNNVTVDVTYTANNDTAYKVEHYLQNISDNDYTHEASYDENKTGTTDTLTAATSKLLTGFTAKSFDQANIAGNGGTIVKVYYDRNSYTLTYKVDGVEVKSSSVKYGATITPEVAPTKTGYTFSGWSTIPPVMPAASVEINGTFTINSHNLTINYKYSNGDEASTQYSHSYNYNADYSLTSPVIAGYTADKLVVSGTIPDNNVTVDVTYTANTDTAYKVKHYTENLISGYTLVDTENKTGTTDTLTNAVAKTLTGFTAQLFSQVNIAGDGETVVEIHYSRNVNTLTYKVDGSIYDSFDIKYGETLTLIDEPTQTGYTFSGWSSIPATMPDDDVLITGTFTINSYTLTFVDTTGAPILRYVDWGEDLTDIPAVTPKTGYTCAWDEDDFTNITSDDTINNICETIPYTVTYNYEDTNVDGETHSNSLTNYNVETPEYTLAAASSTSDNFLGWFTAEVGGTEVTKLAGGRTGHVVLYAHWAKKTYTVNFNSMGGSSVSQLTDVLYDNTITKPTDPNKNGFVFEDWYKEEVLASKWVFATDTVKANLTLYANWLEIYDLIFNMNSSGVVGPITPSNPSTYLITDTKTFTDASSTSHNFLGWFTALDNTGVKVTGITAGTTGDKTYYAKWDVKKSNLTINPNGGSWSGTTPQTLDYGESLTISDPTRDGYTFNGWSKTDNDSILQDNVPDALNSKFTMGSSNTTLTANWVVRTDLSYTIRYMINGTTTEIKPAIVIANKIFGETYAETAPVIPGYEKLDTTKDVTITTGTNEIIFYYKTIAVISASMTSTASSGSSTVEYNDQITYTLTITNTGTGSGLINAKDLVLLGDLDKELIDTGLSASEIADRNLLLSTLGLSKTIAVGETYTLVFKAKVIGNAGNTITNQLTYTVNSEPEITGVLKTYNIEKTVSLVRITESGANIVLTLDTSGSMEGSRLSSMKTAAKNFIDLQDLSKSNICIIRFSTSAEKIICSNEIGGNVNSKKNQLKNAINNLSASGWTSYSSGLAKSEEYINNLKSAYLTNTNHLVFLSDGDPIIDSSWGGSYIYDTGYSEIADRIKANNITIYTIGFETTNSADTILGALASSGKYYKAATTDLNSVFANISADIEISGSITTTSGYADINTILSGMNVNKEVTIVVNGTGTSYTNYAAAKAAGFITTDNRLNVTAFNPSDVIKFKYYAN